MARCRHYLPGFRATFLGVGTLFMILAGMELAQGVTASLAGFGVPEAVLTAPHYQDAMIWVFTHMLVFGLIIAAAGYFVEGGRARRGLARVLIASVAVFTVLDLRTSDSPLGNGLYAGVRSLVPPMIELVVLLLLTHLSFCKNATEPPPGS